MDDDQQAFFDYEQQRHAFDEWLNTDEAASYINNKLMDAMYEDQFEVES